ncbi:hypothetical protein RCL1_005028 [Eukaryota sp. TZLM3-RCL]
MLDSLLLLLLFSLLFHGVVSHTIYVDHLYRGIPEGTTSRPYRSLLDFRFHPEPLSDLEIVFRNLSQNEAISCAFKDIGLISLRNENDLQSLGPIILFDPVCEYNFIKTSKLSVEVSNVASLDATDSILFAMGSLREVVLVNSTFMGSETSLTCSLHIYDSPFVKSGPVVQLLAFGVHNIIATLAYHHTLYVTGSLVNSIALTQIRQTFSFCEAFSKDVSSILLDQVTAVERFDINHVGNYDVLTVRNSFLKYSILSSSIDVLVFENVEGEVLSVVGIVEELVFENSTFHMVRVHASQLLAMNLQCSVGHVSALHSIFLGLTVTESDEFAFGSTFSVTGTFHHFENFTMSSATRMSIYAYVIAINGSSVLPGRPDDFPLLHIKTQALHIADAVFDTFVPVITLEVESLVISVHIHNVHVRNVHRNFLAFQYKHIDEIFLVDCSFVNSTAPYLFTFPVEGRTDIFIVGQTHVKNCVFLNVDGIFSNADHSFFFFESSFDIVTGALLDFISVPNQQLYLLIQECDFSNVNVTSFLDIPETTSSALIIIEEVKILSSRFDSLVSGTHSVHIEPYLYDISVYNSSFIAFLSLPQTIITYVHLSGISFYSSSTVFGVIHAFSLAAIIENLVLEHITSSQTALFYVNDFLEVALEQQLSVSNSRLGTALFVANAVQIYSAFSHFSLIVSNTSFSTSFFSVSKSLFLHFLDVSFDVQSFVGTMFESQSFVEVGNAQLLTGKVLFNKSSTPLIQTAHLLSDSRSISSLARISDTSMVASTVTSNVSHAAIWSNIRNDFQLDVRCFTLFTLDQTKPMCFIVSNVSLVNLGQLSWIHLQVNKESRIHHLSSSTELKIGNEYYLDFILGNIQMSHGYSTEISITFVNKTSFLVYDYPYCPAGFEFVDNQCIPCPTGTIQTQFNYTGSCLKNKTFRDYNSTGYRYDVPNYHFVEELPMSTRLVRCAKPSFCVGGLITAGYSTVSISFLPPSLSISSVYDGSSLRFSTGCSLLHHGRHCALCESFYVPPHLHIGDAMLSVDGVRPIIRDFSAGHCIVCASVTGLIFSAFLLLFSITFSIVVVFHSYFRKKFLAFFPLAGELALRNWIRRTMVMFLPLFTSSLISPRQNQSIFDFRPTTIHVSPVHLVLCFFRYMSHHLDQLPFQSYIFFVMTTITALTVVFVLYQALKLLYNRSKVKGNFVLLLKFNIIFFRQLEFVLYATLPVLSGFALLSLSNNVLFMIGFEELSLDSRFPSVDNFPLTIMSVVVLVLLLLYMWQLPRFHSNVLEENVYKNQSARFDILVVLGRTLLMTASHVFGHNVVFFMPIYFTSLFFLLMFLRPYSIEYFNDLSARLTVVVLLIVLLFSSSGESSLLSLTITVLTLPLSIWLFSMKSRSQGIVLMKQPSRFAML